MFRGVFAAVCVALFVVAGQIIPASAASEPIETLSITNPWARATPPRAQAAGGYLTIENSGSAADNLVRIQSPSARRVEIHEMRMESDIMIMRPVDGAIEIPAGSVLTLAPGGIHIMFMGLNEPFAKGGKVPVTLHFDKAGEVETFLDVMRLGATGVDQQDASSRHGHGQ